jgi:hypothetical protein
LQQRGKAGPATTPLQDPRHESEIRIIAAQARYQVSPIAQEDAEEPPARAIDPLQESGRPTRSAVVHRLRSRSQAPPGNAMSSGLCPAHRLVRALPGTPAHRDSLPAEPGRQCVPRRSLGTRRYHFLRADVRA